MKTARNLINTERIWEQALPAQLEDAAFVARNDSAVLGHRTGAGKTLMAILAWDSWPVRRTIIMGTQGSIYTWRRLLPYWTDTKPTILVGAGDPDWDDFFTDNPGVWLTTFASFRARFAAERRWKLPLVDLVINDELHRILRNRKTRYFEQLRRLKTSHFIGMSATWASRGPQDLWPALHYMSRKTFSSYWKFVTTWCWVDDTSFGKEIYGVRNPERLKEMMRSQYYVARPIEGFPGTRREVVDLDPSKKQRKWYQELDSDMVLEMEGVTVVTPNAISKLTRLRQLCCSPRILDPEAEVGPGIDYILEGISDDPHTVVFSLFSATLDIIRDELIKSGYPEDSIFILRGGCGADEIERVENEWKRTKGVCLCTITFAQSFALDTGLVSYFLGWSWDPNDNIQAEGRLRRMDSVLRTDVLCKYILINGTCDDDVKEVVNGKYYSTSQFLIDHYAKVQEEEGKDIPEVIDHRLHGEPLKTT